MYNVQMGGELSENVGKTGGELSRVDKRQNGNCPGWKKDRRASVQGGK